MTNQKNKSQTILKSSNAKRLGDGGETYAVKHLMNQHFTILARNFRTRRGEIDIVARKKDLIIFVEVKARTRRAHCSSELVNDRKQKKIIATALDFIAHLRLDALHYRFDVILVDYDIHEPHIRHIENAFYGSSVVV